MSLRKWAPMVAALWVLGASAACTGSSATPGAAPGPLKIGLVVSLTGPRVTPAGPTVQGAMVALAEINAGLPAGSRQLQFVQVDDRGDPATAGPACTSLATSDRVVAIVAAENQASMAACARAALKANVPYFASTSANGTACLSNTFIFGMSPNQAAAPLVDLLIKRQGARSFYIVGSSAAMAPARAVAAAVAGDGGTVVGTSYVQPGSTSFGAELTKIAAARPTVVIDTLVGADQIAFHQQLGSDARTSKLKRASLQMDETTARTIGSAAIGVLVADDYLPGDTAPANKAWLAAILRKYGDGAVPTAAGAAMYDAVEFAGLAIAKAGSNDGAAIIAAASTVTSTGPRGPVQIAPFSHGYATLTAHLGQVNPNYGIDQIGLSPPVTPTVACAPA